jgi:hypothetical protein
MPIVNLSRVFTVTCFVFQNLITYHLRRSSRTVSYAVLCGTYFILRDYNPLGIEQLPEKFIYGFKVESLDQV